MKAAMTQAARIEDDAAFADYSETLRLPMDEQLRSGKLIGPVRFHSLCQVHRRHKTVKAHGGTRLKDFQDCVALEPVSGFVDIGKMKEGNPIQVCRWGERGPATRELAEESVAEIVHYDTSCVYISKPSQPLPDGEIYLRESLQSFSSRYISGIQMLPDSWLPTGRANPPNVPLSDVGERFAAELDPSARQAFALTVSDVDICGVKGPPGTGKTWLQGRDLAYLMHLGLRVAVMANSHLVVNNALNACREACIRFGVQPSIGKVGKDKTLLHEDIPLLENGDEIPLCWGATTSSASCFFNTRNKPKNRAELEQDPKFQRMQRDIIMVDEAGQVLAYQLAACAYLAPKFRLFGDEDQLPPIVTGTHTDSVGASLSAMAFLTQMRGSSWIKPLLITHRLNKSLTDTIRTFFYPTLDLRAGRNENTHLPGFAGVSFLNVKHQFQTIRSLAEVDAIYELVVSLLGKPLVTADGVRTVLPTDIMVLSPYRVQVRALIDRLRGLGLGAQVGTVDKMQGQGAHIIIYSMTTSATDFVAAQADWFFQPNRWNVTISRAMAACILVGSIDLINNTVPTNLQGLMAQKKVQGLVNSLARLRSTS